MAVLTAVMLTMATLQPIDDEVTVLAGEVGLDPVELAGAVVTTRSTPTAYLQHEGLLARPTAPVPPVATVRASTMWWVPLVRCESNNNWSAVSRSGMYRGGFQFDQPTWASYGGLQYASSAHLASPDEQIAVAERLRAARGLQPWPVCGRRV